MMKIPGPIRLLPMVIVLTLVAGGACAASTPPSPIPGPESLIPDTPASMRAPQSPTSNLLCPSLAPPTGPAIAVSTEAELRSQAYNAATGTTLLIQPGTYHMQDFVYVVHDGLALRGATGNRDDVILDFGGMVGGHFGILVEADDVTIADLTIRNAADHGVSIQGRDRPLLYNLHIADIGDQLVKVNPAGDGSDDGLLACSRLEYTTAAPDEYTNGISAHDAHGWTVRDNEWYRIRTPGNTPVPAILFWSGSSDTVVERNLLVDCYQGIAFGNASHGPGDHTGGIVRNNVIYASLPHDTVIEMVHATGWLVAHNTALLLAPAPGLTWGLEARFEDSQGTFAYNLTNMPIWLDRDGAQATGTGNLTDAQMAWFVNPAAADLHLLASATAAIDQAATLAQVSDDLDGDARPIGPAPDVGADEYGTPPTMEFALHLPLVVKGWSAPIGAPTLEPIVRPTLQPADLFSRSNLTRLVHYAILCFAPPPGGGGNKRGEECMAAEYKQAIVNRLKSIEGHVRGIQRMVDEDAYCIDIINQSLAVQRALEKVNSLILERHLQTCVTTAIRSENSNERERVIEEIMNVFETTSKI